MRRRAMRFMQCCMFASFLPFLTGYASAACTVSATSVNFGAYDVFQAAPTDSNGTITVVCNTFTFVADVDIGPSPNSGGFNPRRMRLFAGADLLSYNLFREAGRTTIWGDGTSGTSSAILYFLFANNPRVLTVYGRIPAAQDVRAGQYTEILTVTITF